MSQKLYEENSIQDIANAIREKNGTQNQYTVSQMPAAVRAIKAQPILETLSATENGNYFPSSGKDGFSSVTVDVEIDETVVQPLSVTQNGTYNPPSGVDGYAPVTVEVESGEAVVQPLSVTQNGTYNPPSGVDGYAPVTVNVSGGGGLNVFGLFSLIARREVSMAWQQTLSSLSVTWNGGNQIGADAFVGIDLTNVSSISIDVATGNSYSNAQARWYIMLAIMETDPLKTNFPSNSFATHFKVYDEFHERNSSTTLTIDVSNYTGLNYLIISASGWTAEFTNLVIT